MNVFKRENFVLRLLFSSLIASFFSLILLLLFSFIASLFGASNIFVKISGIIIRALSVGLSTFLFVNKSKGLLNGALSGFTTGVLVQLLFLLFSRTFNFPSFALNTLFCVIFGIIFGIIFVNLKNKRDYSWKKVKNSL